VSARATHLKAATENVFVTTIERKQMSNKTTFKRIALAVVAVLGFGVLSVAPSSAAVTNLEVTTTNGTPTTLNSDSSTAAVISVRMLTLGASDSVSVAVTQRTALPTGAAIQGAALYWVDSSTATGASPANAFDTGTVTTSATAGATVARWVRAESTTAGATNAYTSGIRYAPGIANLNTTATFKFDLGETTTVTNAKGSTLVAGTYGFTAVVTYIASNGALTVTTKDFDITVSKTAATLAAESRVVDPAKTIAQLSGGDGAAGTTVGYSATVTTTDSAVSVVSTAASTNHATILVRTFNATGAAAPESVTATISDAGILCNASAVCGSSLTLNGTTGIETLTVRANGTAGIAKIVIKTTSKTFPTKSLTFFATAPSTLTPAVEIPVISTAATSDVVSVAGKDVNGSVWAGTLTLYSLDTAVATAGACTFNATDQVHYCAVTGVAAGTAKLQAGNASTLAAATVKSAEWSGPVVNPNIASSVSISFDKAAYAPGEKARIYVTPLDASGKAIAGGSVSNLLATGGISPSVAFSSGSDTVTATTLTVASASSATTGAKAGSAMYTVYMPFGKGTVTLTAKGGTALPASSQVALTASASVVDDSVDAAVDAAQEATDAAIAATDAAILAQEAADEAASAAIAAQETAQAAVDAVTALSAEVTKLVAQLATLQKLLNRVAKRVGVKL
jgi:hypothetical protein